MELESMKGVVGTVSKFGPVHLHKHPHSVKPFQEGPGDQPPCLATAIGVWLVGQINIQGVSPNNTSKSKAQTLVYSPAVLECNVNLPTQNGYSTKTGTPSRTLAKDTTPIPRSVYYTDTT